MSPLWHFKTDELSGEFLLCFVFLSGGNSSNRFAFHLDIPFSVVLIIVVKNLDWGLANIHPPAEVYIADILQASNPTQTPLGRSNGDSNADFWTPSVGSHSKSQFVTHVESNKWLNPNRIITPCTTPKCPTNEKRYDELERKKIFWLLLLPPHFFPF